MLFLGKKRKAKKTDPQSAPTAVFATGRLAPVFQRMYVWVLSANLNFNSYQVESGCPEFFGSSIPLRGHYNNLLNVVSDALLPEYVERFLGTFDANHLVQTFRSGRTGVCDVFCLKKEENNLPISMEFRAERIPDSNPNNFAFLFFARQLANEDDHGTSFQEAVPVELLESGEIDWDAVRTRRYNDVHSQMYYEYNVATDCFYLHSGRKETASVKPWERFLSTLESHSDYLISHDSLGVMRNLLKNGLSGHVGHAEIVLRMDGKRGSPFRHYQMSCLPLEETGTPTWLFGHMQDVEDEYLQRAVLEESGQQIGSIIEKVFTDLYLIDTHKNTLRILVKTNEGFRAGDTAYNLQDYFEQKIRDGTIAEESVDDYRRLIQKGFFDQRVGKKAYSLNARLKKAGNEEYCWYEDLVCSVPGKPHIFILSRRDISALYAAKEREFEMEESLHLMEHSETMLLAMAGLVEFRNVETGSHIYHVRDLTKIFLEDIARRSPQYQLTPKTIRVCVQAAAMHDIGKITIPDSILNKPTKLTEEEYAIMKTHTVKGAQIIKNLDLPDQEELKHICADVARHHHERWDGSGYPDGLARDEISIYVQAVSLADVLDALVSKRCYKESLSIEMVLDMIFAGECGAFNPRLLETLSHCTEAVTQVFSQTNHTETGKE